MSLVTKLLGKDSEHQVPNRELLLYSTGIAGQNVAYGMISNWVKYFLMTALGIDPYIVGIALMIPKIWDAINDPIVGALIDKHTFKNGEKLRPLLKYTPLPIGIISVLLFVDFQNTSVTLVVTVIAYLLFDLIYSFQDIAQWGMTSLITTDPKERDKISQVTRIGASIGGLLPGATPIILDLTNGSLDPYVAPLIPEKYMLLILAAIFAIGGMSISLLNHNAKERVKTAKVSGPPFASFKLLFKNKVVLLVVLGQFLGAITFNMDGALFFKYMFKTINVGGIRLEGMTVSMIFGILAGIPGYVMMFLATKLARLFGGFKNILVIQAFMNCTIRVAAYLYGKFIGYQGAHIIVIMLILAIAQLPSSLNGIAMTALWGDSIDYTEWQTGERNEATVFSMQNMTAKITNAISTGLNGVTMGLLAYNADKFEGRENGVPVISEAFMNWSWEVYTLAPALGSLFTLIPLLFIKIDKNQREIISKELAERRALKAAAEAQAVSEEAAAAVTV